MYILITTKEFSEKTKISLQMSKLLFARFCFDYVKDKNMCGRTLRYKLTKKIVGQMIELTVIPLYIKNGGKSMKIVLL